jgi:hypothetical protein
MGESKLSTAGRNEGHILPEATAKINPRTYTRRLNLSNPFQRRRTINILLAKLLIRDIKAIIIRHHIRDSSLGSSSHELGVRCFIWSLGRERDDKELLTLQRGDERAFVVVVDASNFHAGGELAAAVLAGYGCHCVEAGFEECGGEVFADAASGLGVLSI